MQESKDKMPPHDPAVRRLLDGIPVQMLTAFAVTCITTAIWWWGLLPILRIEAVPLAVGTVILVIVLIGKAPFLLSVMVLMFGAFQMDQTFHWLYPLRLPFMSMAAASFAFIWHVLLAKTITPVWTRELKALLIFYSIMTIATFTAVDRNIAIADWWTFTKLVFLTFVLAWFPQNKKHIRFALAAVMCCGIVISSVAIYNGITRANLVELTRVAVGSGTFGNPNDLVVFLLFPLAISSALLFYRGGPVMTGLALICLPAVSWTIILTQSRGGLLGVLALFVVIGLYTVRSRTVLIISAILLAPLLYSAMGISNRVSGGAADIEQASAMIRTYAWHAGVRMAMDRPTGVGFGNFIAQFPNFTPVLVGGNYTAHSAWFQVLGEAGFLGLVAYVSLFICIVYTGFQNLKSFVILRASWEMRATGLATLASVLAFGVSASFVSFAYNWPLYTLAAMTTFLKRCADQESAGFYVDRDATDIGSRFQPSSARPSERTE